MSTRPSPAIDSSPPRSLSPSPSSPAIDSSPPRSLSPSPQDPFSLSPLTTPIPIHFSLPYPYPYPYPYPFRFCLREMASGDDGTERWCVVTRGRGVAACHLVEKLISYNMFLIRIANMGPNINLDPHEEKGTLSRLALCSSCLCFHGSSKQGPSSQRSGAFSK